MKPKRDLLAIILYPIEWLLLRLSPLVDATVAPPPSKNRRTRRREQWENRHVYSSYWRDVPWYKIPQYIGGWDKIVDHANQPAQYEPIRKSLFSRYRIVPNYKNFVSTLITVGYIVQKRNWRWKWKSVACFLTIEDAEDYIKNIES